MAYFVLFGALLLAVAFRALLCLVVAHNQLFYRNLLKDSLQTEGELGLPAKKIRKIRKILAISYIII